MKQGPQDNSCVDKELILSAAGEGIFGLNTEGVTTFVNPAALRMLGYSEEEMVGMQSHSLIHYAHIDGSAYPATDCPIYRAYKDGIVHRGDTEVFWRKDGASFPVEYVSTPIFEEGKLVGAVVMFQDISQRKESERRLHELTEDLKKFKMAVDFASDHIIITDEKGTIIYANKAVETITGYSVEEVIGKRPSVWGGRMDKDFYSAMWKTIRDDKKSFTGEVRNRRKNGEEYIAEIRISPVFDEQGNEKFFVGIERDITRAKQIDKAKTEFVSLASHQLRTPLTVIKWYSELLLEEGCDGKQREYVDEIHESNQRMIELVSALLNVSRIDLGTFVIEAEPISLPAVTRSVVKEIEPIAHQKKIDLEVSIDENVPVIEADPKLARIVFYNLISNAVKYTPEKGYVRIALTKKEGEILFSIKDNGYGIPDSQKEKIFSKLFRADNVRLKDTEGTGLGLYIVKSIVDQAGGRIWFESQEGKGSEFFVIFPKDGMKNNNKTNGSV